MKEGWKAEGKKCQPKIRRSHDLEDAGTFGIYKLFWNFLNSREFDDLPLFLVSEECVSKRLHEH